jgi:hypothetical protein
MYDDDDDSEYIPLRKRLKLSLIVDLTSEDDIQSTKSKTRDNEPIDLTTINDNNDLNNDNTIPQSFAKQRRNRMNDSSWTLFRHPRGSSKLLIIRNWLESKRVARSINEQTVKLFIQQCSDNFQKLPLKFKDILTNHSRKQLLIDQDIWDACSFVAFTHLKWLNTNKAWDKHWLRTWRKLSPQGSPFEDIGSMLDKLKNFETLDRKLRYIPFRTSDENENRFNTDLPYTTGINFRTPYERIKCFFERVLDQGIPIAFNQAQHSRVAIAYNDEDILCIDSFPRLYAEEHEYMYFCGGISIVKKLFVYQWVRDAIIYSD